MTLRRALLALLLVCLAVGAVAGVQASGATYTATSTYAASVGAANDWTPPTVTLADPGDTLTGTATLTATAGDARGSVVSVAFQRQAAGASTWATVCTETSSPWSCSWATDDVDDGTYRLRAVATDDSGNTATSATVSTTVANDGTVTLADPGESLSGTVWLSASSSVPGGLTYVFSYAPAGTGSWSTACSFTWWYSSFGACLWNTSSLSGSYDLRVVGTARDGSTRTDVVRGRTLENTVSSVVVTSPAAGATVRGTTTVSAAASSSRGVRSVRFDVRLAGTSSWTEACTDTTAPYSCTAETAAVANGPVDLRAVMVDDAGGTTTSDVVTVTVDNRPLRGQDVQVVGSSGTPSSGDKVVFTYSEVVSTSSVKPGWDGSATTIAPTFYDRSASGSSNGSRDNAAFGGTNLGTLTFDQRYLSYARSVTFNGSTMVAGTQTVAGSQVTVVTVTLGTPSSSWSLRADTSSGDVVWAPSASVRTPDGRSCSTTAVTESGSSDRDF